MSNWTRNLKRYMRGEDVRQVKDKLVELGYLHKATHNMYGNDTYRAVKAYQADYGLDADGVVGYGTWVKLVGDEPIPDIPIPSHISETLSTDLKSALAGVSLERRELCLLALRYATEAENADYPRGFYIRGANLYDTDLSPHHMSRSRLDRYFKREDYAPYYDGGRKEMMLRYAEEHNYDIPGTDCSGMIVGLWRARGIVKATFDANANSLFKNRCEVTGEPRPGDLCWKSGHIGLYVGAGYAVEAAGGAYGIQLTNATGKRKLYNFVTGKLDRQSAWTAYGDPKFY